MKRTKQDKWTAWAGFFCGKPATWKAQDNYAEPGHQLEIFTTRKAARARYQHVEKVEIRVIKREAK